jgi:hypothetical protein
MRKMLATAVLVAAAALSGCGTMFTQAGTIPVSQSLSPQAQAAMNAINEANVLLAAAANVIAQNVVDGISTKAEGQKLLDQVRAYSADVDRAKAMLVAGEVLAARDKAELARKLVVALHREVAARARRTP